MKSSLQLRQNTLFALRVNATQHEWFKKFKEECLAYFKYGKLPTSVTSEAQLEMFMLCQLTMEQRLDLADVLNDRLPKNKATFFMPVMNFIAHLPKALFLSTGGAVGAMGVHYAKYENISAAAQIGLLAGLTLFVADAIYQQTRAPERPACYLARIEKFSNVLRGLGVDHLPMKPMAVLEAKPVDLECEASPSSGPVIEEVDTHSPESPWLVSPSPR